MTRKYAVIFEKGKTSYGAYVPDLLGCVAVGKDLKKVRRLIRDRPPERRLAVHRPQRLPAIDEHFKFRILN